MSSRQIRLLAATLCVLVVSVSSLGLTAAHPTSALSGRPSSAGSMVLPMTVNGTLNKNFYTAGWVVYTTSVVSNVKGSWIVPKVHGSCGSATTAANIYVGIEGYYGSTYTFPAIGVTVGCSGGSPVYRAWYQFEPYVGITYSTLVLHPGNIISASVTGSSPTHWVLKLTDLNSSKSLYKTEAYGGGRTGADWDVGVITSGAVPVYKLTDFGSVHFGKMYTLVNKTSGATIGGTVGSIAYHVNHGGTAFYGTMVKYGGTTVMATTSQIKSDGRSFTVTWKSAGP